MRTDVIIVGAGLSGLKGADLLAAAGKSVVVLEARDRVGGRLMAGELCGHTVDLGARWLGPKHTRLLAEARRFGMETVLQYSEGRNILSLSGRRCEFVGEIPNLPALALVELAMLRRRWSKEAASLAPGAPWNAREAQAWDTQTFETWILKNLSTRDSRDFARLIPLLLFGASAAEVSYLWMVEMLRACEGLEQLLNVKSGAFDATIKGGAHTIARRLAESLGERIVLYAPVRAIAQNENGAVVTSDKGVFEASRVIVAMAPAMTVPIAFGPFARRRALCERLPQTAIATYCIAYEYPFWRRNGYSGQVWSNDLPLTFVQEDAAGAAMLVGFAKGDYEMAAMNPRQRRAIVMGCLTKLFGVEAANAIGYAEKDWLSDEWSRGYTSAMAPGILTHYSDALRAPCGRVHWAGSETAIHWTGAMEGALESGERAASEVLARL